jgi:hypothetical protein
MFYANQHAANDVMKDFCRQKGRLSAWLLGAAPKGAARADFACVAGLVGRRYGGAAPGANDNAGKWLECAGEKMTDTVGHYRVGRSAAWE